MKTIKYQIRKGNIIQDFYNRDLFELLDNILFHIGYIDLNKPIIKYINDIKKEFNILKEIKKVKLNHIEYIKKCEDFKRLNPNKKNMVIGIITKQKHYLNKYDFFLKLFDLKVSKEEYFKLFEKGFNSKNRLKNINQKTINKIQTKIKEA